MWGDRTLSDKERYEANQLFNVKYLIDALSSFETKEVFVSINDEVSPACIFSDETNQEKQKAIIMPMRV